MRKQPACFQLETRLALRQNDDAYRFETLTYKRTGKGNACENKAYKYQKYVFKCL